MDKPEKQLRVVQKTPVLAVDGNAINIRDDGAVELSFLQILSEDDDAYTAQAVANLRLTMDQLKGLADGITEAITRHDTRKKSDSR